MDLRHRDPSSAGPKSGSPEWGTPGSWHLGAGSNRSPLEESWVREVGEARMSSPGWGYPRSLLAREMLSEMEREGGREMVAEPRMS